MIRYTLGKVVKEVEIALVLKEQTHREEDMFRISCEDLKDGWGNTLEEAIKDFDNNNK